MLDDILNEFYVDTQSHLEVIEDDLLQLEKDGANKELIDDLFRRVHSIKGNAGVLGLQEIYEEGQEYETFLDTVRERKVATPEEVDIMFQGLDRLKARVAVARGDTPEEAHELPPSSGKGIPTDHEPIVFDYDEPEEHIPAAAAPAPRAAAAPSLPAPVATPAAAPEEQRRRKLDAETITFLTFSIGPERYGLPIMKVREIILREPVTPVPCTKPFVTGVMNLRDQVIPVFDLRVKLDIPEEAPEEERNVIVVEIERTTTGLKVDEVTGIVTIKRDRITPPQQFEGTVPVEFLLGIGNVEGGTIILLDAEELCSPEEILF